MASGEKLSSFKDQVLENLHLLQDKPDLDSELFQFRRFALQLESFLMDKRTPTPYTVAVHGEWGGGKTSLIRRVHNSIKSFHKNNCKVLWFDAWEYERVDPVLALMQRMALLYRDKGDKVKRIVKGLAVTSSDIVARKTIGLSSKQIQANFESSVKNIPTITEQVEKMVNESRLIVFIDDLDRCLVENALGILEAVKLFLNAEGVIFVIAVDMSKLERAWELRYKGMEIGTKEGREHIDKIFQLKLSLPPKEIIQVDSYIQKLASSLPDNERRLLISGCPPNPRKIKRILNLVYFIALQIEEVRFREYLPVIIIWSIATAVFQKLAQITSPYPNSLVQMSLIAYHLIEVERLNYRLDDFKRAIQNNGSVKISSSPGSDLIINWEDLLPTTVSGLEYVVKEPAAFNLLKAIAEYYSIIVTNEVPENLRPTLKRHYDGMSRTMKNVIYQAGLMGV